MAKNSATKTASLAAPLLVLLLVLAVIWGRHARRADMEPEVPAEGCLACHESSNDPDPSHPVQAFGCVSCHLGNPHALDAERAHAGMAVNPGDLRVADLTCGREQCHPQLPQRVRASIMSSNKGILNTLFHNWERPELAAAPRDVPALLATRDREYLYEDHFAKLCAGCHFWNQRAPLEGERGQRGGGCSGCHVVAPLKSEDPQLKRFTHPELSTRIPSANCIRCHNRSARAGLTYEGVYESAGYGTPYVQGRPGPRRLSGGRFQLDLPADIHHEKGGLTCVDCHTQREVMGDGAPHEYLEEQQELRCEHCHLPRFASHLPPDELELAERLAALNRLVPPPPENAPLAAADKGSLLYTLRQEPGKDGGTELVQYRKSDGARLILKPYDAKAPYHDLPGHERLSCQACHSRWVPQCYGCHIEYRAAGRQRDGLSGQETPGRWTEGRGFMRFETPILALDKALDSPRDGSAPVGDQKLAVEVFSPCQVMVSHFDATGGYRPERSFATPHMSPFDPHSTRTEARACEECHGDPKTLGLGQGALHPGQMTPLSQADGTMEKDTDFGLDVPADAYVDLRGRALQKSSRPWRRPFNAEELRRILAVSACLPCHRDYADPLWREYENGLQRWRRGLASKCTAQPESQGSAD